MHPAVLSFVNSLAYGQKGKSEESSFTANPVGRIARVYEIARNALEYRADNLVRRAAIERILSRQMIFEKRPEILVENLIEELSWARYISEDPKNGEFKKQTEQVLKKYLDFLSSTNIDRQWMIGMASAEIEEMINPNSDYSRFTNFAFYVMKQRINLPETVNIDLVLYVSIDKVYSQSDDQQVAFHLFKLISRQAFDGKENNEALEETWKHQRAAQSSKYLNMISVFVRRQMGPLVLLRDMYFADPMEFRQSLTEKAIFDEYSKKILRDQLISLRGRINTATVRSLVYVFLTKMVLAILIEMPLEKLLSGSINLMIMGLNIVIPVLMMSLLTAKIDIPKKEEREKLLERLWQIISVFEEKPDPREILVQPKSGSVMKRTMYYVFYSLLFIGIFALIISVLNNIGFTVASIGVFMFFMSVISFFAFRIKQIAQVYSYKPRTGTRSTWGEAIILPIVIMGSVVSREVARLNFLVFIFDFVLEAPFKIVLKFIDNWFQFLSLKKDEAVG
jgi:hypothetical protein